MSKPIEPSEVTSRRAKAIPSEVIDAFNELIVENFRAGASTILQEAVVQRILRKLAGRCSEADIFKSGWLDVEPLYREAGWNVAYDKPAYNETYPASFVFRVPR